MSLGPPSQTQARRGFFKSPKLFTSIRDYEKTQIHPRRRRPLSRSPAEPSTAVSSFARTRSSTTSSSACWDEPSASTPFVYVLMRLLRITSYVELHIKNVMWSAQLCGAGGREAALLTWNLFLLFLWNLFLFPSAWPRSTASASAPAATDPKGSGGVFLDMESCFCYTTFVICDDAGQARCCRRSH